MASGKNSGKGSGKSGGRGSTRHKPPAGQCGGKCTDGACKKCGADNIAASSTTTVYTPPGEKKK